MLKPLAILIAAALLATAAHAQDLAGADVVALIKGKTTYLNVDGPRGKGPAVIFYGEDGKAAAKFPNGTSPKGAWTLKGNTTCTAWEDQPTNPCSGWKKQGDNYELINMENGKSRGIVTRFAPGNPEKL